MQYYTIRVQKIWGPVIFSGRTLIQGVSQVVSWCPLAGCCLPVNTGYLRMLVKHTDCKYTEYVPAEPCHTPWHVFCLYRAKFSVVTQQLNEYKANVNNINISISSCTAICKLFWDFQNLHRHAVPGSTVHVLLYCVSASQFPFYTYCYIHTVTLVKFVYSWPFPILNTKWLPSTVLTSRWTGHSK